jgi:hypothetical protein
VLLFVNIKHKNQEAFDEKARVYFDFAGDLHYGGRRGGRGAKESGAGG